MVWWLLLLQLFGLFLLTHVLTESQKLIISLSNSPKSTSIVLDYTIVNPPQQICYGYHKHSFKRISENELDK